MIKHFFKELQQKKELWYNVLSCGANFVRNFVWKVVFWGVSFLNLKRLVMETGRSLQK